MNIKPWLNECIELDSTCSTRVTTLWRTSFLPWLMRQQNPKEIVGWTDSWAPTLCALRKALDAAGYMRVGKFGPYLGLKIKQHELAVKQPRRL